MVRGANSAIVVCSRIKNAWVGGHVTLIVYYENGFRCRPKFWLGFGFSFDRNFELCFRSPTIGEAILCNFMHPWLHKFSFWARKANQWDYKALGSYTFSQYISVRTLDIATRSISLWVLFIHTKWNYFCEDNSICARESCTRSAPLCLSNYQKID